MISFCSKFLRLSMGLLLLFSFSELRAQSPQENFQGPRATMNFFLQAMEEFQKGNQKALDRAVRAFDLSQTDTASRIQTGRLAAQNLIKTLNRIEKVDIEQIPKTYGEETWFYRRRHVTLDGQKKEVQIAIGKTDYSPNQTFKGEEQDPDNKTRWLFTPETVQTIGDYARAVKDHKLVPGAAPLLTWKEQLKGHMPAWLGQRTFLFLNGQWIGIFLIIFLAGLIDKFGKLYLNVFTRKILKRQNLLFNTEEQRKLYRPLALITFALCWLIGVPFLEFSDQTLAFFLRGGKVVLTVGIVMASYHLVDIFAYYFEAMARRSENKFDDILVPLIRKAGKTLVIILGVIVIGDSLTLNMKSLLAGLGIGGIAFALAAKDTLANIFGSLTVLLDRPFRIGDWVNIGGGNLEGMVEEVGLRSTRIRTFYDSLITVPNGQLTNVHIDNYGLRQYRRYSTSLSLQYDTPPEKIEAFCEGVRQIIENHPWTRKDYYQVHFNHFNSSSLDVLLYVFWSAPDWASELQEKHKLLMDILKLAKELDIRFAFPTQTLHMFKEEHTPYRENPDGALEAGLLASQKILSDREQRKS